MVGKRKSRDRRLPAPERRPRREHAHHPLARPGAARGECRRRSGGGESRIAAREGGVRGGGGGWRPAHDRGNGAGRGRPPKARTSGAGGNRGKAVGAAQAKPETAGRPAQTAPPGEGGRPAAGPARGGGASDAPPPHRRGSRRRRCRGRRSRGCRSRRGRDRAPRARDRRPRTGRRASRRVARGAPPLDERRREKGKKRKKGKKSLVDQEAVAQNISRTLATLKAPVGKKGVHRREEGPTFREVQEERRREEREREKTLVRVTEFITVSELANTLKVPPTQIVTFAFKELGQMVTINQRLDFDMIELIASAFGFQAVKEEEYATTQTEEIKDADETLKPRPPVVTIMGHVDHGKTSLLDYVRKANVVAGEAGGITQHIGAYQVTLKDGRKITFLDTPGHEAFTAMRARGAQVTDIVVLVVAADDAIMPQTIEAISHAKNAGVPIVVAINKIDLPAANVQKVKQDLLSHAVVLEEFGGTTLATPISAKTGQNVDGLLDQILLQAELLDLKANPDRRAHGTVLEATLDPGKGPLATILVQNGTLRVGEDFICGQFSGRVRAMYNERGETVTEAGPSTPVQILGFEGVPEAGDTFSVMADAGAARVIAQKRQRLEREAQHRRSEEH